jgi:hypothetical protein
MSCQELSHSPFHETLYTSRWFKKKYTHFDFWILCFDKLDWLIVLFGFFFLTSRNSRIGSTQIVGFHSIKKSTGGKKEIRRNNFWGFIKANHLDRPVFCFIWSSSVGTTTTSSVGVAIIWLAGGNPLWILPEKPESGEFRANYSTTKM